jgi:SAM-dependent methyltransferase
VCSCGGRDGFLISRLLDHCKNLPKEVVGDFCFTPIDEKGQAIKFKIPAAIKYLKGIDPRPKFSTLSELRNRHCKILLPLAQTNDPNVGPVDIEKRVTAVKAVLSAGIVAHCVLSEKMAELLLPPKVRGYQLLHKVSYDQFGIVYSAMRLESSVPINVRIMDSSNPADEKAITSGIAATPSVEKEIIISDPLEPIDDVRRSGQGFPYLVMGSIKRVRLSAGVRKPGNWAATAIRISVEQLERDTKDKVRILDMGCGSGAIGLYLALSNQVQKVVFADIDHEALRCVTKNIEGLHPDIAKKCTVVEAGDLFSKLGSKHRDFDIIIFGAPFFPNLEEGIEVPDADLSGRTGNEITLRFVTDVWHYLREGGCAITYLPDYVPYDVILATAKTKKLDTEKRKFAILYPATPKCQFPPALEIQHRVKLEGWLRSTNRSTPFTDEIWSNRRFLGFEMVFFVMRKRR